MSYEDSNICLIPARGGSKRVPRKNWLPLNGIPLLAYSIKAAIGANVFDRVVVSTEDLEIAKVAKEFGAEVDNRPHDLASDFKTKDDVLLEFILRNKLNDNDQVTILLPTCPFRTTFHIIEANSKFKSGLESFKSLISVCEFSFPIDLAMSIGENEHLLKAYPEKYQKTRSQEHKKSFHPNGAIYISTVGNFKEIKSFFGTKMQAYLMNEWDSFDIDTPEQFSIAEAMMNIQKTKII
ncbi:MAG: CMP-N-acetylneuraminic acid synthetase [Parvicellaceae bacterium]|jgi:CMP-N-acetylneuraminic acid synthetase